VATPLSTKQKNSKSLEGRRSAARVQQDDDSTGDPWTRLGNFFLLILYVVVFLFAMNDTLFKSLSMHLYILSCMVY